MEATKLKIPKKIGRPTSYTPELAINLCEYLALGESLRTVCAREGMPSIGTIFVWLRDNKSFHEQYARAKEESAEADHETLKDLGDEAIALAQKLKGPQASAAVQAVKLKADNIKWSMSKLKPKKYGDKVDLTSDGSAIQGNTIIFKKFDGTQSGS